MQSQGGVLVGTAEVLRGELAYDAAGGKAQEEVIEERLAMLDKTTAAFTEGSDEIMKAPENVRRIMLERLGREVERRLMLKGELPDQDVRRVHEQIRTSLPESVIAPLVVSNEDFLGGAGKSKTLMRGYERHLDAVNESLRALKALSNEEKRVVAAELSEPESARALLATIGHPEEAVAFAVVRSRAADASDAVRGLSVASVIKVEELLSSAKKLDKVRTQLSVCRSDAGCYLGKAEEGKPPERFSSEYWKEEAAAETALRNGRFNYRDGADRGRGFDR